MSEVVFKSKIPENARDVVPPIEPAVIAHFEAIQDQLTPREHSIVRRVASGLSAGELAVWFVALSKLTVADAVEKIRALVSDDEGES